MRFPGLALPANFLFYKSNPLPLHLYDFALHFFRHWSNIRALTFYVPKLESEEEARYVRIMIEQAEQLLRRMHPDYKTGSVRLIVVVENARALFRLEEIMDALGDYFVGASLGWHDFLASTARLFKHDSNYRVPVKADPNIVIHSIKASHDLLVRAVGRRGGLKIGGMYGVLPVHQELSSASFQVTLRGFFKDIIAQLRRGLTGFWVAQADFVRIGLALIEAWREYAIESSSESLERLVNDLLITKEYREEVLSFIFAGDIQGLQSFIFKKDKFS